MDYKDFEEQANYKANDAGVLVNPTNLDKKVKWDGKEHVILSGKEKPFPNYIIRHFLKHCKGLKLKDEVLEFEESKKVVEETVESYKDERERKELEEKKIVCELCGKRFKREQDKKSHLTRGYCK